MMSVANNNVSGFNASIAVTELLMKTLENVAKDLASRCIVEAAGRHGFNAEEEIRILGLENLSLIRKQMAKKSVAKGEKKVKAAKEVKPKKEKKSVFPMPFVPDAVDIAGCQGLAYNRGLFTQCMKKRMENGNFCNGCQSEADKNASGCPDCGTVEQRLATDLYEYKDPKGRSPVSYMKVLGKLKLSPEAAAEEADRLNIEIPTAHLVVKEETKKNKGRPAKKVGAIEAENVTDLFAKLSAEGDDEVIESDEESKAPKKKAKLTEEEKEAKKKALEEKKKEREAKLAEEKKEREEKRKAELEQKKKEREEKLAEEKKARELKREQEKQEREQKKALEKAEKESKKGSKKAVEPKAVEAKAVDAKAVEAKVAAPVIVAEKPKAEEQKTIAPAAEKVKVSRIQIAGKAYLKSSTNILYDPNTKEEVGLWDPETKTIKDLPEDDDDEEEEEYYD